MAETFNSKNKMTIKITRVIDPLTRQSGFSAALPEDSCFSFSESQAISKLISRNRGEFVVEHSNGSISILKTK